jgi:hypothetical protein
MSEADDKILTDLNAFSIQAMQALMAARLKAGQRGAGAIELGDLLPRLIVTDQGSWANLLPDMRRETVATQSLFLDGRSRQVAERNCGPPSVFRTDWSYGGGATVT